MTVRHRIIYIIDGLGMGGAERLMVPILKHLNLDHFDPRVCVFQVKRGNPVAEEIRALGIPVDFLHVKWLRDVTALPRLVKYLKNHQAEFIHTQLEFADTLGNIASRFMRLPSVCTLHTLPPVEKKVKAKARQKLSWLAQRRFCDRVISVSEGAREYYLQISKNSPSRVITLYNGIDLTCFDVIERSEQQNLRQSLGIPTDASLLTTVAVLRPQKGIQYVIDALPAMVEVVPDLHYLVVGSGSHMDVLVERAEKIGMRDRIIFTGMRSDVPKLLSISDIFVLPTLTEALPTVLAEAMAARKPIIASAVGGVPEMIADKKNGLLIPPGDSEKLVEACILLLKDPDQRKAMGEAGWEITNERFNIRRQVKQLESVYERLLHAYGK